MNTAREIMSKKLITLETTTTASEMAKIMKKNNVNCIVLTQNEKPCGIITERDLLSKVMEQNKKPSDLSSIEILSSPLTTVSSVASVNDVAQTMLEKKVRHIIVEENGQPLGIITVTDFLKHLNTRLEVTGGYRKDLYENIFEEFEYWDR